jgi:hypothetical protein
MEEKCEFPCKVSNKNAKKISLSFPEISRIQLLGQYKEWLRVFPKIPERIRECIFIQKKFHKSVRNLQVC